MLTGLIGCMMPKRLSVARKLVSSQPKWNQVVVNLGPVTRYTQEVVCIYPRDALGV